MIIGKHLLVLIFSAPKIIHVFVNGIIAGYRANVRAHKYPQFYAELRSSDHSHRLVPISHAGLESVLSQLSLPPAIPLHLATKKNKQEQQKKHPPNNKNNKTTTKPNSGVTSGLEEISLSGNLPLSHLQQAALARVLFLVKSSPRGLKRAITPTENAGVDRQFTSIICHFHTSLTRYILLSLLYRYES